MRSRNFFLSCDQDSSLVDSRQVCALCYLYVRLIKMKRNWNLQSCICASGLVIRICTRARFLNVERELKCPDETGSPRWQRLRNIREDIFQEVLIPPEMLAALSPLIAFQINPNPPSEIKSTNGRRLNYSSLYLLVFRHYFTEF